MCGQRTVEFNIIKVLVLVLGIVFALGSNNIIYAASPSYLNITGGASFATGGGNVGINTTAPSQVLTVVGNTNISGVLFLSGTSCSANNVLTTTANGSVICVADQTAAASGGNVSAAGTAGYIPQFQNATFLNISVMFQNGTNIGIGTTNPIWGKLVVHTATNENFRVGDNSGTLAFDFINDAYTTYVPMQMYASQFSLMNGNVGIGTTVPSDVLTVNLTGTDLSKNATFLLNNSQTFIIRNNGAGGSVQLRATGSIVLMPADSGSVYIQNTTGSSNAYIPGNGSMYTYLAALGGYVGIGTTVPRGILDVNTTTSSSIYLTANTSNSGADTIYIPGHIYIIPYGGTNVTYLQARRGDNSGSTEMQLRTYNGGVLTNAIRIVPNGSVGIGTMEPTAKLQVYGLLKVGGAASQQTGTIALGNDLSASQSVGIFRGTSAGAIDNGNVLLLGGYDGVGITAANADIGSQSTPKLFVNISGNVGIGTTAPAAKLDVNTGTVDPGAFGNGTLWYPAAMGSSVNTILNSSTLLNISNRYVTGQSNQMLINDTTANWSTLVVFGQNNVIMKNSSNNISATVGAQNYLQNNGNGNIAQIFGTRSLIYHGGNGTVSNLYGTQSLAYVYPNNGNSTSTNAFGITVGGAVVAAYAGTNATLTTAYGTQSISVSQTSAANATALLTTAYGINAAAYAYGNYGTANITNAYGGRFSAGAAKANGGNSSITNAYDAYLINGYSDNSGNVTNAYGLYIEDITHGDVLNYAIYSAGGTIYFGGNVSIGTATPLSTQGWTRFIDVTDATASAYRLHGGGTTQESGIGSNGVGLFIDASGHATATNNRIYFRTEETNSQFTPTTRMTIDETGNVGIGVASPVSVAGVNRFLEISGPSHAGIVLNDTDGGENLEFWIDGGLTRFYGPSYGDYLAFNTGYVGMGTTTLGTWGQRLTVKGVSGQTPVAAFVTNDFAAGTTGSLFQVAFGAASGNTYTELKAMSAGASAWNNLVLQSGGNVGIGTVSPTQKLTVVGAANITSDLYLGTASSMIRQQTVGAASDFTFLTSGGNAANIYTGGLFVSNSYSGSPPAGGIYSLGGLTIEGGATDHTISNDGSSDLVIDSGTGGDVIIKIG